MVTTGGQRRVDRRQHRGRGAAARVLLDQGVRPAVQREVPRRQVLPVARGDPRRGVPAGDGRCAAPSARAPATSAPTATPGRSARPSTCCCGSSRCARAATACSSGPARSAGPCLLGYIDKCSAPCVGRVTRRGAPRDRRRLLRLHGRPAPTAFVKRLEKRDVRRRPTALDFERAARLRDDLGALEQGAGEAGRRARRRHRRRRDRPRRGPARGRGADLLRPRRPDPRPARLGGRQGRGRRHRRAGRALPAPALRRARPATPIPREILVPALPDGRRRRSSSCSASCAAAGSRSGCRSAATSGPCRRRSARNAGQALALHKTKRASDLTTRNQALEEIQDGPRARPRRRCASSATTSPTSRAPRWSPRWWSSRTAWPARASTAGSSIKGVDGQNDVASMHEVITRRFRRLLDEQARARRAERTPRTTTSGPMLVDPETGRPRKFAYAPSLVVVDGGPPQVGGRPAGARRARHRRRPGVRPGQAARGGVAARRGRPGDPAAHQRGPLPAAAGPRRGAPVRHHPPPLAAVQDDGREPARRRPRAGRGAPQDACSSTSAR